MGHAGAPSRAQHLPSKSRPLEVPLTLKLADRLEFFGWPKQILFELRVLLRDRDEEWLTSVAEQVHQALQMDVESRAGLFTTPLEPDLLRLDELPYAFDSERPGQIGIFTAVEPTFPWSEMTPRTERWERYAVFALLNIRDAIKLLGVLPTESPSGDDTDLAMIHFGNAGGFALEAMRALQIAHSLRIDSHSKSARGRSAAVMRHVVFVRIRTDAVDMANSRPFKTKEEALDFITSNLIIDPKTNKFCSRSAASKWLREAGWQPVSKRNKP